MPIDSQNDETCVPKAKVDRPIVPFVRLLNNDNLSECPTDHNFLIQLPADLEYSRDFTGGSVVTCPVLLRFCPSCRKWYIDQQRLKSLEKQGINLDGFDILRSEVNPRPDAFHQWHPEATVLPAVPVVKTPPVRKSASAKPRTRAAVSSKVTDKNLAFDCRCCDGGQTVRSLGYRGACSQACYYQNVVDIHDSWCSDPANTCQTLTPDQFAADASRCCESHLLTDWSCVAGPVSDDNPSVSAQIIGDRTGAIALITTVLPRESEANRRIFAIFLIGNQGETNGQTTVTADARLRLELMSDEPLYFWKFFQGKSKAEDLSWESEPYRNISQDAIIRILNKAARIIKDPDRKAIAEYLFTRISSSVSPERLKKLVN